MILFYLLKEISNMKKYLFFLKELEIEKFFRLFKKYKVNLYCFISFQEKKETNVKKRIKKIKKTVF